MEDEPKGLGRHSAERGGGWDPAKVILVFSFLQIIILVTEWFWFLWQLSREVPLVSMGSKALTGGTGWP